MKNLKIFALLTGMLAMFSIGIYHFTKEDLVAYNFKDWSIDTIPCVKTHLKKTLQYEGTLADWRKQPANVYDRGGITNGGIIFPTYKALAPIVLNEPFPDSNKFERLSITEKERFVMYHLHKVYFNLWKHKGLAIVVAEIAWGSGLKKAGLRLQRAINRQGLNIAEDGEIGVQTINAANDCEPFWLNKSLFVIRLEDFEKDVSRNPEQRRFLGGWQKRAKYNYENADSLIRDDFKHELTNDLKS